MERHRQGSFSCSVLIMLTKYCSQSREMASNASSSRLTRPRKSDVSSRRRPFAEFSSVAGANAPAFVERGPTSLSSRWSGSVAGANAPAFVERFASGFQRARNRSVAGANAPAFVERSFTTPQMASRPRRVAGANAPAFVERSKLEAWTRARPSVAGANAPAFVERTPAPPGWKCRKSCRRS